MITPRERHQEETKRRKAIALKRAAKISSWAGGALAVTGECWSPTTKPGISLTHALIQARAQQYAADNLSRALNRIAAALEALATADKP